MAILQAESQINPRFGEKSPDQVLATQIGSGYGNELTIEDISGEPTTGGDAVDLEMNETRVLAETA